MRARWIAEVGGIKAPGREGVLAERCSSPLLQTPVVRGKSGVREVGAVK